MWGLGAVLGGAIGKRIVGWAGRQITRAASSGAGRAAAGAATTASRIGTSVIRHPLGRAGGAIGTTAGGVVLGQRIVRRGAPGAGGGAEASVEEIIATMYAEHGQQAQNVEGWKKHFEVNGTEKGMENLRDALIKSFGPKQQDLLSGLADRMEGGGGGGLGNLSLITDPEVVERLTCPAGFVLVDVGEGPVCMIKEVAYALGLRKRARGGGITGSEVRAAKKVQRFGTKLFVARKPKVPLRRGK